MANGSWSTWRLDTECIRRQAHRQLFNSSTLYCSHTDTLQSSHTDTLQSSHTDTLQSSHTDTLQSSHTDTLQSSDTDTLQSSHNTQTRSKPGREDRGGSGLGAIAANSKVAPQVPPTGSAAPALLLLTAQFKLVILTDPREQPHGPPPWYCMYISGHTRIPW
ncbi:hypothetical protein J1614_003589 [Plenodomus biglobosus]|nr:hypothetical protein J1614_003589 [Plenodomus biglobosus]